MDEKIRLFNEKKKSFDNIDGDEHLCEAYLKGDAYIKGDVVELSFWYNKNCYPENFIVTLDDFLNKPLEDLIGSTSRTMDGRLSSNTPSQ